MEPEYLGNCIFEGLGSNYFFVSLNGSYISVHHRFSHPLEGIHFSEGPASNYFCEYPVAGNHFFGDLVGNYSCEHLVEGCFCVGHALRYASGADVGAVESLPLSSSLLGVVGKSGLRPYLQKNNTYYCPKHRWTITGSRIKVWY